MDVEGLVDGLDPLVTIEIDGVELGLFDEPAEFCLLVTQQWSKQVHRQIELTQVPGYLDIVQADREQASQQSTVMLILTRFFRAWFSSNNLLLTTENCPLSTALHRHIPAFHVI